MRTSKTLLALSLAMVGAVLMAGGLVAQGLRETPVMSRPVVIVLVVLLVAVVGFFILRRTRRRS